MAAMAAATTNTNSQAPRAKYQYFWPIANCHLLIA
jgi:hypothetical protein